MFDNIGGKIKGLALNICWLGIIASLVDGIRIISIEDSWGYGIVIAIVGSVLSWISSFFMYGFGELIEGVMTLNEKMDGQASTLTSMDNNIYFQSERIKSIEKQLSGLQTENNPDNSEKVNKCKHCGCVAPTDVCPLCGKPMDK